MKNLRLFLFHLFFLIRQIPERKRTVRPVFALSKTAAVLLAILMISGCYNYYKNTSTKSLQPDTLRVLVDMDKTIVVHSKDSAFVINNIKTGDDSLSGYISSYYTFPYKKHFFPAENTSERYLKKKGDARLLNEVHIYTGNLLKTTVPGYFKISFALKEITRIDIYNKDTGRTLFSWIVGFALGIAGFYVAIGLIVLIALIIGGASCPYIYVNTGNGYDFAGEIYSGAVYAPLERNDYLVLTRLVAENGDYKLKISNELEEVQNTNLTELFVIDHPDKSEVLVDKYGNYQTAQNLNAPLTATNLEGIDILDFVKDKDSISYYGLQPEKELPLTDGLIMTFNHPEGAVSAKVFLRAQNSIWLDYVYKMSHDLFGSYYNNWLKKQNKSDPKEMMDWSISQKIPLSLYVERNGEWVFCDYYNMAGPMALKEDVLAIDLKGIDRGPLKIKLESGACFWNIDYVGIDYSLNIPLEIKKIPVEKAITNEEHIVTDLLKYDDLKYYTQAETFNVADLSFSSPPVTDAKRTVILHSKGYYQIPDHAEGLPKIKKLKKLHEPGQFLEFSRELMKSKIEEFSNSR